MGTAQMFVIFITRYSGFGSPVGPDRVAFHIFAMCEKVAVQLPF